MLKVQKLIPSIELKMKPDSWLSFVLLFFVAISIFLTENHNGGFVPGGLYSGVSIHGMTLSRNLMNSEHPLFMYMSKEIHDGKITYDAYNRFPVFPFLLTGILTHPFEHDLALQSYLARQLMNIFFFLSIIITFRLVYELVDNKYWALCVALVAFSSNYMLFYNDMIFNDIPALLGFTIALYGVAKAQKSKLKISHIIFYSLFPISLGWQPYAVYATWFLIESIESLFQKEATMGLKISNIFKQQSFKIMLLAVIWGALVLGLQLLNEWRIVGGSFAGIPSVNSALWRSGIISAKGHTQYIWAFDWPSFLSGQSQAIATMLIPFWPIFEVDLGINASILLVASLIIYTLIRFLKDRSNINRMHLILIFSGLLWAIPMRRFVALHEFQSIFYVGFTISAYTVLLSHVNSKVLRMLAIDVALVFLIAVSVSNHLKAPNSNMNQLIPQFQTIRNKLPANSKIFFDGDKQRVVKYSRFAIDYYLVGYWFTSRKEADYAISKNQNFSGRKLTSNPGFNLYSISHKPEKP